MESSHNSERTVGTGKAIALRFSRVFSGQVRLSSPPSNAAGLDLPCPLLNSSVEVVYGDVVYEFEVVAFDLLKNIGIVPLQLELRRGFFILELQRDEFFYLVQLFNGIELFLANLINTLDDYIINVFCDRAYQCCFVFKTIVDGLFGHGQFSGNIIHGNAFEPKVQKELPSFSNYFFFHSAQM